MRAEKKSIVEVFKKKLDGSTMFILTDHTGLNATQFNKLRLLLRKNGSDFVVVKNRLFLRAAGNDFAGALADQVAGPTSIALGSGDCAVLSRLVTDFAKENQAPRIKAGFAEGVFLSAADVGVIAALPPREVLLARFVGGLQGSLSGFVGVLREMLRQFVSVVDQIAKKQDGE